MTERTNAVTHVTLTTDLDFNTVTSRLESLVPPLDPALEPMLARGDAAAAAERRENGPPLYIFSVADHGAVLAAEGKKAKALQYTIGNPLTAVSMTKHDVRVGLYAPLRVLLYERKDGRTVADYDLPSTLFGQFGVEAVTSVGRGLDKHLRAALDTAMADGSGDAAG